MEIWSLRGNKLEMEEEGGRGVIRMWMTRDRLEMRRGQGLLISVGLGLVITQLPCKN